MNILYHWINLDDIKAFLVNDIKCGPLLQNLSFHSEVPFNEIICLTNLSALSISVYKKELIKQLKTENKRKVIYNIRKTKYKNDVEFFEKYKRFLKDNTGCEIIIEKSRHTFGLSHSLRDINKRIVEGLKNKENIYIIKNNFKEGKSVIWNDIKQKNLFLIIPPERTPIITQFRKNYFNIKFEKMNLILSMFREDPVPETFNDIITSDPSFIKLIDIVSFFSKYDIPILLRGETGTGKELFAKAIHSESNVKDKNIFVAVNCTAIPESLFESELFGIDKRKATGVDPSPGMFEKANRGTLFLDEIGDMPLVFQKKLLRVLQENEVTRIGGKKVIPVKFRLISATHRNLEEMIKRGEFREDLYYRISDYEVKIPSLVHRNKKDIIMIAVKQIEELKSRYPDLSFVEISKDALKKLTEYSWPGNIRQLIKVIRAAFMIAAYNSDAINLETLKYCQLPEINDTKDREKQGDDINKNFIEEDRKPEILNNPYKKLYKVEMFEGFKIKELFENIEKDYLTEALKQNIPQREIAKMLGLKSQQNIDYRTRVKYKLTQ